MRKFTINCNFGKKKAPFDLYVGEPASGCHPLKYQDAWLREFRGGMIPTSVMKSFEELYRVAKENDLSFEELCEYAVKKYREKYGEPNF